MKRNIEMFIEEAQHSGEDTSEGESGSESEGNESFVCDDEVIDDEVKHRDVDEGAFKKVKSTVRKTVRKKPSQSDMSNLADAMNQARSKTKKIASKEPQESKKPRMPKASKLTSPELGSESENSENEPLEISEFSQTSIQKPKSKLASNKFLPESRIPPKPSNLGKAKLSTQKTFVFRIYFTNGAMFHKFLLPIADAVNELRFNLTSTPEFKGIRLEAHDTYLTLANKSRFECDIEAGITAEGCPISTDELTGLTFCVPSSSFMQTLGCATLKDTVLTITKYVDSSDKVTFESITNENDVQTVYTCDLLAESRLESLKGMQFNLGYHVNLYLKTLKEQTVNAKKCGAATIFFALYQCEDASLPDVVHSRLSVGFKGSVTSGSHDFYQSARKIERNDGESKIVEWEPLACLNSAQRETIEMKRCSYNEYDNSKLRLFLNHMDIEWVLIHLCNDGTQKPLLMECEIGGKNTKHIIIVAPKMDTS